MVRRYKFPDNIDDAELERQKNHPAIKAHLEAMKQFPETFAPEMFSFRHIIQDWEDQEEIKEETALIVAAQPKHLLGMPGRIIEYCYFRSEMVLSPYQIRNYRPTRWHSTEPARNISDALRQFIQALLKPKDTPPQAMSRHLPEGQERTFFENTDQDILKILAANPDADLKTYEAHLKIKIVRDDIQTPPEEPKKVIKGFHT